MWLLTIYPTFFRVNHFAEPAQAAGRANGTLMLFGSQMHWEPLYKNMHFCESSDENNTIRGLSGPFESIPVHPSQFDSIRVHRSPFESIRVLDWGSYTKKRIFANQGMMKITPSEVVRVHLRPFKSIRVNSTPFESIGVHSSPSEAIGI